MKLIFGGSGLVGSNFTDAVKLSSRDVNLLSYEDTLKCIQHYKPELIVHSACKKLSSKLLYDNGADYFDENVKISLNIFKAAAIAGVDKVIVIASINAFLKNNELLSSDMINHNIKKTLSTEYHKQYGLKSKVIYLSNVFGPFFKDTCNGFVPFIIEKCHNAIKNKTDINLIGNKLHKRNFIYIKDVIDIIESNINSNEDMVITTKISYTLEEVVNMVTDIMNFDGNVIWSGGYDDIQNKDIESLNHRVKFTNKTSMYNALEETIGWYLENEKNSYSTNIL